MKTLFLALAVSFSLAGCANSNCSDSCAKVKACANLSSAGISCDASCKDKDADCAACLNDDGVTCDNAKDKCGSSCPATIFDTKK